MTDRSGDDHLVDGAIDIRLDDSASAGGGPTHDRDTVRVLDTVQDQQFDIYVDDGSNPVPTTLDAIEVPTDAAVGVETSQLVFPHIVGSYVRDPTDDDGVEAVESGDTDSFGPGRHVVEIAAPMKLYAAIPGEFTIVSTGQETIYLLEAGTRVTIAARSLHDVPAGTITVPEDAELQTLCRAVNHLSSALKAPGSPERSWPTLRGHPPLIEVDGTTDGMTVPDGIDPVDTGVTVEIPPRLRHLYTVVPLAFYLGATVRPTRSDEWAVRLHTARETYTLGPDYEEAVARTLKHILTLDCVVRTEGLYGFDLDVAEPLAATLPADLDTLYDAGPPERLTAYLEVPFGTVDPYVPRWPVATHLDPTRDNAALLPFVANDLATVYTSSLPVDAANGSVSRRPPRQRADESPTSSGGDTVDEFEQFLRTDSGDTPTDGEPVSRPPRPTGASPCYVLQTGTDAVEDVWAAPGCPATGTKAVTNSYRARVEQTPVEGTITVDVACLDGRMEDELAAAEGAYGASDDGVTLPFGVNLHTDLSTDELRMLLREESKFVHFIGHATPDGLRCTDGSLDVRTMDEVGIEAFFLNACESYRQGIALCERGAVGGAVTLDAVPNSTADRVGQSVARLMNAGFTLQSALVAVGEHTTTAGQYVTLGDGRHTIAHTDRRTPTVVRVLEPPDGPDDTATVEIETYTTSLTGVGCLYHPYLDDTEHYFLTSGTVGPLTATVDQLLGWLQMSEVPIAVGDTLHWSTDLSLSDLVDA